MKENIPNTIEEIKAKLAAIEAAEAKKNKPKSIEQQLAEATERLKQLETAQPIQPPTKPQPIPVQAEVKQEFNPELHVTKTQAALEVQREIKTQKTVYIISVIGFLLVYGLSVINFYASGVAALLGVGFAAYYLAKATQKANYLKQTYSV